MQLAEVGVAMTRCRRRKIENGNGAARTSRWRVDLAMCGTATGKRRMARDTTAPTHEGPTGVCTCTGGMEEASPLRSLRARNLALPASGNGNEDADARRRSLANAEDSRSEGRPVTAALRRHGT